MNECSKCGGCCSNYLPLTKREITRLKRIIKERNLKPEVNMLSNFWYNVCPFLDNANKCSIYAERPAICRAYTCKKALKGDYSGLNVNESFELVDLREEIWKNI